MVEAVPINRNTSVLTLPNSPNWDCEAPASFVNNFLAYCANASVHVLELTDCGFVHRQTISFSAKFKKQFCRCMTVLILDEKRPKSILVSLDKRSLVWEKLRNNKTQNQTE